MVQETKDPTTFMKIDTVLLDLGGVLVPDTYETVLLHEQKGIARNLGLSESELVGRVRHVWDKYAILPNGRETDFWKEIATALQIPITAEEVEKVKHEVIVTNSEAGQVFDLLKKHGLNIGVISNNTVFFYSFQAKRLSLHSHVDPALLFLSHEAGMPKSNGLFQLAAKAVRPESTLIIDDRESNIDRAQKAGFMARHYSGSDSLLNVASQMFY